MGVKTPKKPKKEEPVFSLLCVTTDSESYAQYAEIQITASLVRRWLDHFRPLYRLVARKNPSLYCLEFWDSVIWGNDVRYADTGTDELCSGGEWFLAPDGVEVIDPGGEDDPQVRMTAETMHVTKTGIFWSASPKHGDSYIETPELTWKVLEQLAKGKIPLKAIVKTEEDDTDVDSDNGQEENDETGRP